MGRVHGDDARDQHARRRGRVVLRTCSHWAARAQLGQFTSLVAHVKDLSAGKISLLVGSSEFHVTDRTLVAALAEAVESARRS